MEEKAKHFHQYYPAATSIILSINLELESKLQTSAFWKSAKYMRLSQLNRSKYQFQQPKRLLRWQNMQKKKYKFQETRAESKGKICFFYLPENMINKIYAILNRLFYGKFSSWFFANWQQSEKIKSLQKFWSFGVHFLPTDGNLKK